MYNGNNMENYDEQDFPGLFENEEEIIFCYECGDAIPQGYKFRINNFWGSGQKNVCMECANDIVNAPDTEPGDWGHPDLYTWVWIGSKPANAASDLFKLFGEMFNPENNKI